MNREHEFRGFDSREWRYGDLEYNRKDDVARIHTYKEDGSYGKQYIVDPDTVGQFTGQYDKKGKPIYEGDVFDLREFCIKVVYEVDMGRFVLRTDVEKSWMLPLDKAFCSHCAIVGNIHDNPELLDAK